MRISPNTSWRRLGSWMGLLLVGLQDAGAIPGCPPGGADLRVRVLNGHVPQRDNRLLAGKTDAYVVLRCDGVVKSTGVVLDDLSPEWDELINLGCVSTDAPLTLKVCIPKAPPPFRTVCDDTQTHMWYGSGSGRGRGADGPR